MRGRTLQLLIIGCLTAMTLIHALLFWNAREMVRKGSSDFAIYYCAGTMIRQGLGHRLYDNQTQFEVQRAFAPDVERRQGALPYTHPPFEALFFAPFSYLSYTAAFTLWDVANLLMLVAIPFLLRPHLRRLREWPSWAWVLAAVGFFPIFLALLQGQDAILLLFLYALAYIALRRDQQDLAGVWLALGLFKFHLVLPFVLLLLLQGKTRILRGFLPATLVLGVVSIALVGPQQILSYPRYVLHLENNMAAGAIVPADMPNLRGVISVLLPAGEYQKPLVLALSAGVLIWVVRRLRAASDLTSFDLKFSLAAVATAALSYHALGYDLSMLLLVVFLLMNRFLENGELCGTSEKLIAIAIGILFFSPLQIYLEMRHNHLAYSGMAVLLLLFAVAGAVSNPSIGQLSVRNSSAGD